jgi:hypothetical protein
MNPRPTLERMPGLYAVAAEWGAGMGDALDPFRNFFQLFPTPAKYFPCPRHCGCAHVVIHCGDGSIFGRCRCKHWDCDDFKLTDEEITLWQLNLPKLSRAICKALGLTSKFHEFGPNTFQIGTWSADAVPAFLTIQWDEREFPHVVASLVADQKKPFILLAPTSTHMDATSQRYLASVGAELFSLETNLTLTEHGTFQPRSLPGEIFARFRPEPKEALPEDVLRRAVAVLYQLDPQSRRKHPSVLTVFRLYCREELSVRAISRRCHCALGTVMERLKVIEAKTGIAPENLRRVSRQIEKIEEELTDARAKHIDRTGAIQGERSD